MRKELTNKLTHIFTAVCIVQIYASDALAQSIGNMTRFESLASTAIRIVQGLALVGCVAGFIRVGLMYSQGDDRAPASLKNTGIGTAVVAGAAIIMEFVRSAFTGISL